MQIKVPDTVNVLLIPIAGDSPTGVDAKRSPDPVINSEYVSLQAGMTDMTVDYPACAEKAVGLLSVHTKDLWVCSWLTLCWSRMEGATGLRDGLYVILEYLKGYGDALYPQKPKQRLGAIQALAKDKWLQGALVDAGFVGSTPGVLAEIDNLLSTIEKIAVPLLADTAPNLSQLREQITEQPAQAVGQNGSPEKSISPDIREVSEKSATENSPSTTSIADDIEAPSMEVSGQADDLSAAEDAGSEPEAGFEYTISREVRDLLSPVSGDNPAGEDVEKHSQQEVLVLFGDLQREMGKYSDNDYSKCASWAVDILADYCKHLRVAAWLLIAWYRIDNLKGLHDGLVLLIELLNQFESQLFPAGAKPQSKAIQLLNADRRLRLLKGEKVDKNNADKFVRLASLFDLLQNKCETLFSESPPRLKDLLAIFEEKREEAEEFLKQPGPAKPPQPARPVAAAKTATATGNRKPASSTARTAGSSATTAINKTPASDKDARTALSGSLQYFFVEKLDVGKKFKTPDDPYIYALSRTFRWAKLLKTPEHKDFYTQLNPPEKHKSDFVEKLISQNSPDLIPYIESNFLTDAGFIYWLDAQKAVVEALEAKGENFEKCAEQIKLQLALLMQRVDDLKKLKFSRAQRNMPFASAETQQWLEEEVELVLGSNAREKIMPPIMGENYEPINTSYQQACEALPNDFEQNLQEMQNGVRADDRPKGKFLRMLNMANFCSLARRYPLARAQFNQLMKKIDEYHIADWENALCVSVWQSNYLNNNKMLETELSDDQRNVILNEQQSMFDKIAKFDSVLALNLLSNESPKGETQ